jgi:hypothetical protein
MLKIEAYKHKACKNRVFSACKSIKNRRFFGQRKMHGIFLLLRFAVQKTKGFLQRQTLVFDSVCSVKSMI